MLTRLTALRRVAAFTAGTVLAGGSRPTPILMAAIPASTYTLTSSACAGSDTTSSQMISYYQAIVTGKDTATVRIRKAYNLPATTSDSVVLVSDPTACGRARAVYVRDMASDTLTIPTVYTIKVGSTRYIVTDRQIYGSHGWDLVTDTSFTVIVFAMD